MSALIWATLLWVGIVFAAAWLLGLLATLWVYHKFKNKSCEDDIKWDVVEDEYTCEYVKIKEVEYGERVDRTA